LAGPVRPEVGARGKESANYTGRREKKPASRAGFRAPV